MEFGRDAGAILVVEDDPDDQQLMLRAAQKSGIGCKVFLAESGPQALDFLYSRGEFVNSIQPTPNAIFIDLSLPGMSGLELLKKLRAEGDVQWPVIVYTGSSNERDVVACYVSGANSVIQKSGDYEQTMSGIGEAIRYWLTVNRTPNAFLHTRSNPYVG